MPELDRDALAGHIDRLYRAAWALSGSREDAEDLVQETFLRVLSRRRELRRAGELPYLLASLRNTFLDDRRRAARRPRTVAEPERDQLADPSVRTDPVASLQIHETFAAIAALPLDFRLTLVAVDVTGLSHREAAALLHTRESTIATRLFRARARVARALDGADPRGGALDGADPRGGELDAEACRADRRPQREREGADAHGRLIQEGRG